MSKNNRLDINGSDNKPFPQEENFTRNDWGGQVLADASANPSNPDEVNIRQDVNGSSDKAFPQERNFIMNAHALEDNIGKGENHPEITASPMKEPAGQVKYARREGAVSIYKDATRNTEDDNAASAKAEDSCVGDDADEGEKTGENY